MNLGKDASNLGLHFNPRFDAHGDVNTIVCNSKKVEEWGAEHRETVFPFQKGSPIEVRPEMHPLYVPWQKQGVWHRAPNCRGCLYGRWLASPAQPVPPPRALSSDGWWGSNTQAPSSSKGCYW